MGLIGKTVRKFKRAIGYTEAMQISEEDKKLLETIRKCIEIDADATELQREKELDDLRFCDPDTQWTDDERASREANGRPVLTEDRLGPFLANVCNEQRKNKPGVQVNPVDDQSDVDTAEVIQGLIRHIEYASNADTAYDTAVESAVRGGRGFYRVTTDYVDAKSFEQEILIKRIINPHDVYIDPAAEEADYSDAKWGGIKHWLSKDDFEEQYPGSHTASIGTDAWRSIGDDAPDWMSKDGAACMVVEHYYKVFTTTKIYLLDDGQVVDKLPEGVKPKASRDAVKVEVKWVKCTAVEILERGDFAASYIPIIPVLGKELVINGQRTYAGLIRSAKDPQKRYNYLLTAQTERIAFMPLATWIGARGFMGKEKRLWQSAHKQQMATLEYDVVGTEDKPINAPRLITEEAPIRAVTEAMVGADMGLKATTGIFNPALGNREGSQSGLAIGRLQQQSETSNFHIQDNLSRALRLEGRIILDLIPKVYDTPRVIRIIGEDGTQETMAVNGRPDPLAGERAAAQKLIDLTVGKYDVTVSSGPSYQTKRQEDRALLMTMLTGPMGEVIAAKAPDLVAKTLDSPIAKELTKRLTPPEVAAQEQNGAEPLPPQVKAQMDAMMQQHEQLTQALHAAQDALEQHQAEAQAGMAKAQLDAQTKLEIARIQAETELTKTLAQIEAQQMQPQAASQALEAEMASMKGTVSEMQELILAMHGALAGQAPAAPEQAQPEPLAPGPGGEPQPDSLA